jgi:KaiC/GvpD/RAD55 family RecA-like ATPase
VREGAGVFPENYSMLVVGEPSAGMFEFCCYLAATYVRSGQRTVFVGVDSPPSQVRRQMEGFGASPSWHEEDGDLVIVDCYTAKPPTESDPRAMRICDVSDLGSVLGVVEDAVGRLGGSPVRVVVNSLTPLFLYHGVHSLGRFFRTLSASVKEMGSLTCTAHTTVLTEAQISVLEAGADGLMEMRTDSDFRRYVRMRYMRGMKVPPNWVPLDFMPERDSLDGAVLEWRRPPEE